MINFLLILSLKGWLGDGEGKFGWLGNQEFNFHATNCTKWWNPSWAIITVTSPAYAYYSYLPILFSWLTSKQVIALYIKTSLFYCWRRSAQHLIWTDWSLIMLDRWWSTLDGNLESPAGQSSCKSLPYEWFIIALYLLLIKQQATIIYRQRHIYNNECIMRSNLLYWIIERKKRLLKNKRTLWIFYWASKWFPHMYESILWDWSNKELLWCPNLILAGT